MIKVFAAQNSVVQKKDSFREKNQYYGSTLVLCRDEIDDTQQDIPIPAREVYETTSAVDVRHISKHPITCGSMV